LEHYCSRSWAPGRTRILSFLGLTFAIIALAAMPSVPFAVAFNILLVVQFVNLGARYGFGQNHLTKWKPINDVISSYGNSSQLVAAGITLVSFSFVLFFVGRALVRSEDDRRPRGVRPGLSPGWDLSPTT
jgi:hypothetical protein